jgi:hypothetical protein
MKPDDAHIPAKRFRLREVQTYEVVRDDFDNIETEAMNIGTDFAFATACIPVAITLTITLLTVPITNQGTEVTFLCLMFICYILGLRFAVSAWRHRGSLKKFMQRIRDNQEAPLGEKGAELEPSELQELPSEEAGAGK